MLQDVDQRAYVVRADVTQRNRCVLPKARMFQDRNQLAGCHARARPDGTQGGKGDTAGDEVALVQLCHKRRRR